LVQFNQIWYKLQKFGMRLNTIACWSSQSTIDHVVYVRHLHANESISRSGVGGTQPCFDVVIERTRCASLNLVWPRAKSSSFEQVRSVHDKL
jgi:hypothetical protein